MADRINAWLRQQLERMPFLKRLPAWAWGLVFLGVLGAAALAATPDTSAASNPNISTPFETAGMALGVFLKLALVIALIYASLYLLRRWKGILPGAPVRQLAVMETLRLSPRQSLHLVKVSDRLVLIGATDQNLSLLTEVKGELEPETSPKQAAFAPIEPAPAADFKSMLARQSISQ